MPFDSSQHCRIFPPNFDVRKFIADYWQQAPLLIRGDQSFRDPVSPEDLAGLACECNVESRLVTLHGRQRYELRHGPFKPRDFRSLGVRGWTLLVQSVDQWMPEVAALKANFSFLPSWRLEDVMVSYATPGGGVGPHFDRYDVFLLQGRGKRRWRLGQQCTVTTPVTYQSGLRILKKFNKQQEFLLNEGDVLYIPPGVAHWGVSLTDSQCFSIGFRAPSAVEMVQGFAQYLEDSVGLDQRFQDQTQHPRRWPGLIGARDLKHAYRLMVDAISDEHAFCDWFGQHVTNQREWLGWETETGKWEEKSLKSAVLNGASFIWSPASRSAFFVAKDHVRLFINGESRILPMESEVFVRVLTSRQILTRVDLELILDIPVLLTLLTDLLELGYARLRIDYESD